MKNKELLIHRPSESIQSLNGRYWDQLVNEKIDCAQPRNKALFDLRTSYIFLHITAAKCLWGYLFSSFRFWSLRRRDFHFDFVWLLGKKFRQSFALLYISMCVGYLFFYIIVDIQFVLCSFLYSSAPPYFIHFYQNTCIYLLFYFEGQRSVLSNA